jgi:predicted RND superfamily exporter protein
MTEPKRQRHLMDPSAPRKRASAEDLARLARVQRWVVSVLVTTTILHLSAGLVIGSAFIDEDRPDAIIALNVLASAFGVIAIAAAFAIHQRSLLSPWLMLGVLPGVVGVFLVLR